MSLTAFLTTFTMNTKLCFLLHPSFSLIKRNSFSGTTIAHSKCTTSTSQCSRKYPILCANDNKNSTEEDDYQESPLSRRLFLLGTIVTSALTAAGAYRFVVGEDLESRIQKSIKIQFPSLFPRETTPEERRLPLNSSFAKLYYDAIEQTAIQMKLLTSTQLHKEEAVVQELAVGPFFGSQPVIKSFSNSDWLNYLLYARLHVICSRTSPKSRLDFVDKLSLITLKGLKTKPLKQSTEISRVNANSWIDSIRELLDELQNLGWISGYRIDDFDGAPGSLWQDEGRSSLTIFEYDPVTMQTAQLIGEEQYEEISPKLSGWVKAFLVASGIKVSYEDYYLDNAYRPDPEQYKPTQFASQFDLVV